MPPPSPDALMESWWPIIIAVVIGAIYALRQYFRGDRCMTQTKLDNKTIIITGGSSGIGRETALDLAKRGARVILAVRDVKKSHEVTKELRSLSKNPHIYSYECDFTSMNSIRSFAEKFLKDEDNLHLLINNAGVMMSPEEYTIDNFELHMAVNYINHFLLTHLLLDRLRRSAPSRVIFLSASAYNIGSINFADIHGRKEYNVGNQFSQSKLAVMLFAIKLAEILKDSGVTVYSVNPGIVRTNIHRNMGFRQSKFVEFCVGPFIWFLMKTPTDGAQTVIYCATAESVAKDSGRYYKECCETEMDDKVNDPEIREQLYQETLKWTKLQKTD